MSTTFSTYYDLIRVREMGPEAKDWASTDSNYEIISLLLKAFEQHTHTGTTAATMPAVPVTVTIANPAIFTLNSHGFSAGQTVQFSTTGSLPTGLSTGTTYYVLATGLTTNSFRVSTTLAGAAVATSGTQTGTMTLNTPFLTELATGGILSPGITVGVRLSYLNALGLETNATVEQDITLSAAADRPDPPQLVSTTALTKGLAGGTYIYVLTKTKASGETEASDILSVTVPYDQTYQVNLTFDAISSYSDGATGLNLYRSAGLNSRFQLVEQFSDVNLTTYTDNNTTIISPVQQPPSNATFDKTRSILIDWSELAPYYPSDAVQMNVYVTQQPGIWGNVHLLSKIDLTTLPIPTTLTYAGSEVLNTGYPYDSTQIPSPPSKINLATQTTGGFVLTADGDFQQHQAKNLVVENKGSAPTATNGAIYYDTSINQIRAYINGTWTNWGISVGTAYTHPSEEVGGHMASHIKWVSGGTAINTLLNTLFDSVGNNLAISNYTSTLIPASTTSTASSSLAQMTGSPITVTPSVNYSVNSQTIEITVHGSIIVSGTIGGGGIMYIAWNGSTIGAPWQFTLAANSLGQTIPVFITMLVSSTSAGTASVYWAATGGATLTVNSNTLSLISRTYA